MGKAPDGPSVDVDVVAGPVHVAGRHREAAAAAAATLFLCLAYLLTF